jgi:deoxyribonuclease-4
MSTANETKRIRVRQLLNGMNSLQRTEVKRLLPPRIKAPETPAIRYPNALLTVLPKGDSYSLLGWITEDLLRIPSAEINLDAVIAVTLKWFPTATETDLNKIRVSKTTQPYIEHIVKTRQQLEKLTEGKGPLRYEETVAYGQIEGHPDIRTDTQIFEVKMTGQLKENWASFVYQVFAYGALASETTAIYLVFPMQELIWHYDPTTWKNRIAFRDLLSATATKLQTAGTNDVLVGALIREQYLVGFHAQKKKSLPETILALAADDARRPYQIFLGSNMSSKLVISDAELAASAKAIMETNLQLYVHSQYIINLCQDPGADDDYHTNLLIKNLDYAALIGCRGVVVHVGKSTTKPLPQALANMQTNLRRAMDHATPACPILLETPAGQGSETLQGYTEFVEFILKFQDPRLRICVDTCHVFAVGHQPLDYLTRLTKYNKKLLKLVHYNDSATPCGSHLDRHAMMGTGHIGMTTMGEIAHHCHSHAVPMVIE